MKYLLILLFPLCLLAEPLNLSVEAEAAILINADTGAILFQKNAKQKMYPASITKIATALYAIKNGQLQMDKVVVAEQDCIGSVTEEAKKRSNYTLPSYWLVTDCSHMGIKKGESFTLKDLMYGMMLVSADDASNMIAYTLSDGNIPVFMEKLNEYLRKIGCIDTYFNNPHGLHHPNHVTTAYDMAIITKEALKQPLFRQIISSVRYTRPKTNKQDPVPLVQTNKLLRKGEFYYSKAIGGKTGWTSKAGHNFVAAAKEGNRTLIAVVLNEKERNGIFKDSIKLFEAAFNQPLIEKVLIKAGPQKYLLDLPEAASMITTYTVEDGVITYYPAEEPTLKAYLNWHEIKLPIQRGDKVGELQIVVQNGQNKVIPLYARDDVDRKWSSIIKSGLFDYWYVWIGIGLILCLTYFLFVRKR